MLKYLFIIFLTFFSSNLMANVEVVIECGDTFPTYVDTDLTDEFKSQFFSPEDQDAYLKEGYTYFFAGRNCGKGHWESNDAYEVLVIMEEKSRYEPLLDLFGPFSTNEALITLNLPSKELLLNGVILAGNNKGELLVESSDTDISGVFKSKRGQGKTIVIIKKF